MESPANRIDGQIERITFRNEETHFIIAKFRVAPAGNRITILGHLPDSQPGETLRLTGQWSTHPRYGEQFNVSAFEVLLPSGVDEIRRYLSSGLIRGIGPATTERLIAHFKGDTLDIISSQPQRLEEVRGIGQEKARRIGQAWQEHNAVRRLMQFLQDRDIKPAYAARIYKMYGLEALEILKHDPYRVAEDIPRVGFYIADAIVRSSDWPVDDVDRGQACLRHLLETSAEDGHLYILKRDLLQHCSQRFDLDYHALQSALELLEDAGQVTVDRSVSDDPVYLQALYAAESSIALRVQTLLSMGPQGEQACDAFDDQRIMEAVVQRLAIQLSSTQLDILRRVLRQRLVVVTGGPGTGKTTLIQSIAAVLKAVGRSCVLAAPTGRAARRMSEVTGLPASTIHKLLGYTLAEGQFEYNQDNPLDLDALIVDEASMIDILLMDGMIRALPHNASLVLVGDVFQLPSVGPGTVLGDIIGSGAVPAFELKEVFRQAAQSPIIANAHKVRNGELPHLTARTSLEEFTFIEELNPNRLADTVVSLCCDVIPNQLGIDPAIDVQVLTPMHKGPLGTLALNRRLKAALNPSPDKGPLFHLNDKVMQLRNNYDKSVFNGEIGTVCRVDRGEGLIWVAFDGREVCYEEVALEELTLAYAISVHKSQGSEYPVVLLVMTTQHYVMLQRNLLYTALTRARKMLILVGSAKAVRVAVSADAPNRRRSLLAFRLNPDTPGIR